jgi:predicted murein hydrolase (TIGR00659 family)
MTELALAVLFVALTLAPFYMSVWLQRRVRSVLFNPVLVAVAVIIGALLLADVDYATYDLGGRFVSFFLGPSVVAIGVPLYLKRKEIYRQRGAILTAIVVGSIVGVVVAAGLAMLLGASDAVVRALAPRSVTTPIAIGIAERIGGIAPLTAALVISSGVLGAVVGPKVLRLAGVVSPTAFGLAMGASAHGIGTARALDEGMLEGATAGLAIGLMGLATAAVTPALLSALFAIAGR